MKKFTKSIPILMNSFTCPTLRQFHNISYLGAKFRRAPSVTAKIQNPVSSGAGVTRIKKTYNPETCLPPLVLLQSGHKSGALSIDPHSALELLRQYQELAEQPTRGWEKKLCSEFNVEPSTLVMLSRILNRCPGDGQRHLARKVMLSASELGEASATHEIISSAIRTKSLDLTDYATPLQRLGILAKKEGDRQAMTLLGKVLLSQRQDREALEWFRKASQGPVQYLNFEGAGEALVHEGRILLSWNDREGAGSAFRKAALELDDPSAYFYLSQLEEAGSSQQKVYLLKAASSGIVEAWHNLGSLELSRIKQQPKKPSSMADYGMAREWFQVAAADGFGLSMLNLALICRSVGQLDDGLRWLDKAEELPEVREQAKSMRAQWGKRNVEIL